MLNQSLLDALLCFSLVVVPTARCFSSDSYAGSVITRSTDSDDWPRSQSTASRADSSKISPLVGIDPAVTLASWGMKRNASFYADAIVSSRSDSRGHRACGHEALRSSSHKEHKDHKVFSLCFFVTF